MLGDFAAQSAAYRQRRWWAMMEHGFIALHRSLLGWEWYQELGTKALFLHLLLTANYQEQRWSGIVIQRGQRVCSRSTLAKELGMSEQSVRTSLARLKRTGEIDIQSSTKFSIISIINYDKYQKLSVSEQPSPNQPAPEGKPSASQDFTHDPPQQNKDKQEQQRDHFPPNPPDEEEWRGAALIDVFWEAYPKKKGYGDVSRWFMRHRPEEALVEQMCTAIGRQQQSEQWTKSEGRYIPRPIQWLERQEWRDELPMAGGEGKGIAQLLEMKFAEEAFGIERGSRDV